MMKNVRTDRKWCRVDQMRVQMYLTALGYNPGPIDGIWGGKTLKALNAVRADKELPAIKSLDEKTLELLEEWHFFHSGTRELPNK